ncbi:sensor histidine kinase [Nocardiopsis baichengensis]|uniref:sensor histidine kinase n=1 Tax=Nocardiopsis baichengensis TaxID=280240 RepID=UPI0003449D11|nr:sensor domain-containing protein [Nocardiopsis baichengensis]
MIRPDRPATGRLLLLSWSLLLVALAVSGTVLLVVFTVSLGLSAIWIGLPMAVMVTPLIRSLADTNRRVLGMFLDEGPIPSPYSPLPQGTLPDRIRAVFADPGTWRDMAWLLLNGTVGALLAGMPALLIGHAVYQILYATVLWRAVPDLYGLPVQGQTEAFVALVPAVLELALFWTASPGLLRLYARLSRWLLAPTEKARLHARVQHLATSRADTIDAQASEVRRIERDLHDGAQARLVALGMSLGMAEELMAQDPETARRLLAEAREATRQALDELRDLVRGIHPPVLVERGLDGAVRALAVSQQLPIEVAIDLPGRAPAPVESAAYFAVAEVLTNAAKHSGASRAWVRINHVHGRMAILVGDDGRGGVEESGGSGLRGIRRRLDSFDGTMNIVSPAGGPTIVTMELPCALSSPKTWPSSATG